MNGTRFGYTLHPPRELESVRRESRLGLCCPECGKAVPLMGRREVVRHPLAERLREKSFEITGWWGLFLGFCLLCSLLARPNDVREWPGWWVLGLMVVPAVSIYFVTKCFPRYRVWACPYCGFHRLDRLRNKVPAREKPLKERWS